ncbi:hypothetical protein AAC387_Pa09g0481 [Persea americana]
MKFILDGNQHLDQVDLQCCDVTFNASSGQLDFGIAMFYRGSLVLLCAAKGPQIFFAKEAETRSTLFALEIVKKYAQPRIILCLDALEVVKAFGVNMTGIFTQSIATSETMVEVLISFRLFTFLGNIIL